jgi:hypothetical protein
MMSRYATMSADEPEGQRFDQAVEALAEGNSVAFQDLLLSAGADGVTCHVETSWQPDNVTEEKARVDLARAERNLTVLLEASERLRHVVGSRSVSYVLVEDYRTGLGELCRLVGGELKWARVRA